MISFIRFKDLKKMTLLTSEQEKQFQAILRQVQDAYSESQKTGKTIYELYFTWNVQTPPFEEARNKLKAKGYLLERCKNPKRLVISW